MLLDLSKLQKHAQDEVDQASARAGSQENEQYPVVYTGENGKLTVRLLYNVKMGGVQRKLIRHTSGSSKVACLQAYGESCPICEAISNAETVKGKECGAFSKYGFKTRGVCYAQIIDHEATYFTGDNAPKKKDVVLLMYPKTVYDQINKIIVDSGENIDKLLSNNEGIPIVIERSQKKGGFPEYKAYVYPYGAVKSFDDDAESTGEQKWDNMLSELPNLGENFVPDKPSDDIRNQARALAETITQEYINGNVVNPGDEVTPATPAEAPVANAASMIPPQGIDPSNPNPSQTATAPAPTSSVTPSAPVSQPTQTVQNTAPVADVIGASGKPECFGKHEDGAHKCMVCPYEADCYIA